MRSNPHYRWIVVTIFFFFILLHQSDKLLISPLTTPIMESFQINEVQMGAVFTGALLVSAFLYPLWGYLYDRYARAKLLALASLIWGTTTWISAIAPTYTTFILSRSSTGIDDSSYPGLYSLLSDYFPPKIRGKVYGLIQLALPLGYMSGLLLATLLSGLVGWRGVFYITGSLGILLAIVIFFTIKEIPRGKSEPEFENISEISIYKFNPRIARELFKKPSLLLLFAQGFVGMIPWNVITYWFFRYLETERNYSSNEILMTMVPAILVLAAGYFIGGALGDFFFNRTSRGRTLVAMSGVLAGAIMLTITFQVPLENQGLFLLLLLATALFIPFSSPNVIATVYDIALPEVRSTAIAIQYFIENGGAALAPLLAGIIAVRSSLHQAILIICLIAWFLGAILLALTSYLIPEDIKLLRSQMQERADAERKTQSTA